MIVQLARRDPALARGVVHRLVARPATFLQPRMRTSSLSPRSLPKLILFYGANKISFGNDRGENITLVRAKR